MTDFYFETTDSRVTGRFGDGAVIDVKKGRERSYPGLPAEAPSTIALYELAREELQGARRVLDAGSGSGAGTHALRYSFEEVVGIDCDEGALEFARRLGRLAQFVKADIATYESDQKFDGAVLVDLLGHVRSPFLVLRAVRRALSTGAKILIAEAASFPMQSLRSPARRAFSHTSLQATLGAAGFLVTTWPSLDGTFLVCVAEAIDDSASEDLANGALPREGLELEEMLAALRAAETSSQCAVRVEAALSAADILYARGDGDGAGRAYFRAREMDSSDPRPLAGLARISLAIGNAADALSLAGMALRLDATDLSAVCMQALAFDQLRPTDALGAWRVAANLAPDNLSVVARYAELATAHGQSASALVALEKLRSYGDTLELGFHLVVASVLLSAGRPADARLEARLAMLAAPGDPEVTALWDRVSAA